MGKQGNRMRWKQIRNLVLVRALLRQCERERPSGARNANTRRYIGGSARPLLAVLRLEPDRA